MQLYQVGVTHNDAHPIYIVDGVLVTEVGTNHVIDTNGKRWNTQHGYARNYKIGDNVFITHVHGTAKNGPTLHNKQSAIMFNERAL